MKFTGLVVLCNGDLGTIYMKTLGIKHCIAKGQRRPFTVQLRNLSYGTGASINTLAIQQ